MQKKYIMALDAGTSSSKAILFDKAGEIVSVAQREFPQIYPKPGWVEHDPLDLWYTQLSVAREAITHAGISPEEIAAIGITNQRETSILWDRETGTPIMNAIVWQDRRTAGACDAMKERGLADYVAENTGLVIDAYFSGTKIQWMLDHVPGARKKAQSGLLAFGTVDSWLIWKLSGGRAHVTDHSNASRTLLYNIKDLCWDERLLKEMDIERSLLPDVRDSSSVYATTDPKLFDGAAIPIAAAIGDQQAALFGQSCFDTGMVKATYGTGGSLLMNTGTVPVRSAKGLLTTIAWSIDGKVSYALEGLLFNLGSVVQWLRDELKIIHDVRETEVSATNVPDTNGVYLVPAFTGLAAPYWDQYARGTIVGLTRGAGRDHIVRAALESMAYQIRDVINCMEVESGNRNLDLKVDGGAAKNDFIMQFQADLLGVSVSRPRIIDSTARGAAFLAGLATGFWRDRGELASAFSLDRRFEPAMERASADVLYAGWCKAVARSRDWEAHT